MSFFLLILSNLLRQKIRTGLTVLGISIGITTVVALGIITDSARGMAEKMITAGGSDFSVGRAGSADLTFSTLTEDDAEIVRGYEEIEHVSGVLMAFSKVGSNPFFVQIGIDPADLDYFEAPVVEGSRLSDGGTDEMMLGIDGADQLGASVGDTVEVRDQAFTVVGVYDVDASWLNSGAILNISAVRDYEKKQGLYTLLYARVKPGTDIDALTARIESEHSQLATLAEIDDINEVDQGLQIMDAANLGISILAVFIGGIAVMNTMVMAVFERTREFGILRAVGWRTRRILQMVLGESLLLCLFAAVFGSALAVIVTRLIVLVPTIRAFLSPVYTPDVFVRGLLVGIGVALLGAIYPAYRAASFTPAQAIRYE